MKDSIQLSDIAAVAYPLLLVVVVMISCLPKIRCINLDGPKCQFVRKRKQRTEETDEEMGNTSFSRTYIDCPLFPCIEFVSETTSFHSGSDWYIPSDDSMVDVIINETAYSVPLSLMMPNYTAWKWERERRKMIRTMGDDLKLKHSTSLPCISNLCSITNQQKLHSQRKHMQSTAMTKSPFTIRSKPTCVDLKEGMRVDVKEGDGIRGVLKDFHHSDRVKANKALISKNRSFKDMRENYKLNINEETQCWYIKKSKSLDEINYSTHKSLKTCRAENEKTNQFYQSMDHSCFTYHQDIENKHNMKMNKDFVALKFPVYVTDSPEQMKSQLKMDMDVKTSYKNISFTEMKSHPKLLENSYAPALDSLSGNVTVSKLGDDHHSSADSSSAKHASSKKENGTNSVSLNCLGDEKNKHDGKPFQKQPYSRFTDLKYETGVCPTCDYEFPPKLCNCSSVSSSTGSITTDEAPLLVMEDEMEIYPSLLQETPSGLYLNPSSTSRIADEGTEDDFTEVEFQPASSSENRSYSSSDNENCTKEIGQ